MANKTLCWQCGEAYPIDAKRCPICDAANANVDLDAALQELESPCRYIEVCKSNPDACCGDCRGRP